MLLRICSAAIVACSILGGAAQAQVGPQVRSLMKMPDPRGEFVRLCAPHMVGRWAHPESVCGCLHDYAAATIEDPDLRQDRKADAAMHVRALELGLCSP